MSEILVNTIKKADGTGSITVPATTGTLVDTSGADFTGQVTVQTADASGQSPVADADELVLENNGNAGMTIVTSDGGTGSIRFNGASAGSDDWANIRANYGDSELRFSTVNSSNMTFRTGNTERMRVDTTGVLLGRTQASIDNSKGFYHRDSDGYTYIVRNTGNLCLDLLQSSTGDIVRFNNSSIVATGTISCTGSTTSYNTSSDYRLKENVVDMTGAIDRVKALNPSQFNFVIEPDRTVDGFLAHEVQAVVPEAVTGTKDEVDDEGNPVYQGIDQSKLVPLLTGALQEAIAKIETLETTVADLQTRVTALENA